MLTRRLVVSSVALSLAFSGCSSDETTSPASTSPATEAATTTTVAPAPTDAPTTTEAATTTTAPDVITLDPDGIGDAKLGDDPESVIAYFTSVFGPITADSGVITGSDIALCDVDTARFVHWQGLYVAFAPWDPFGAGAMPDMQFVYYLYGYSDGLLPDPLVPTDRGLKIDDTADRLIELYPSAVVYDGALGGGRYYKTTEDGIIGPSGLMHESDPELIAWIESGDWPCADTR